MLPGCCKNGIVISKIPVMQAGLKEVIKTHFPEYDMTQRLCRGTYLITITPCWVSDC